MATQSSATVTSPNHSRRPSPSPSTRRPSSPYSHSRTSGVRYQPPTAWSQLVSKALTNLASVTSGAPPFLDPMLGYRLRSVLRTPRTAPIWSRALEDKFCERKTAEWQDLLREEAVDVADMRRLKALLAGEQPGTRSFYDLEYELELVRARFLDRAEEQGTVLVLMRTCYWAYEIYHEVTPTRIDKRLKMFPYHYESTLHERDVFEAIQRGESAESSNLFDTSHNAPSPSIVQWAATCPEAPGFWRY